MAQELLSKLHRGDSKALARSISLVENEVAGYEELMQSLPHRPNKPVIGITGPPGAGKSTLVDSLIGLLVNAGKKIGVLCVDPSSPFNLGSLLGDRIRMSKWYDNPNVFIRSLATRGSLGGLHPKIIEITELMKAAAFDIIIVETVGVGQSEVEIAGLADITIVVLVPEAGDEIQTMKAGLMEIADIFVVNKADRPDADEFVKNLRLMLAPVFHTRYDEVAVIKTVALQNEGVTELLKAIEHLLKHHHSKEKKYWLLAERAFQLIQRKKMNDIDKEKLKEEIKELSGKNSFQLYSFIKNYL
ncbi:MAG TPA: methylmalonyl Co-A mutase-associated GTPase MeaB [Chitinophagaceae bacterium]|nr:methylmalonyl Co-A mutase-associated GTPase MeaB [Chitinophagaceae bacterium]